MKSHRFQYWMLAARKGQLLALGQVWDRLTEFGKGMTSFSLSEISAQLEGFTEEIVAILGADRLAQHVVAVDLDLELVARLRVHALA